jgi:hypothetical protein
MLPLLRGRTIATGAGLSYAGLSQKRAGLAPSPPRAGRPFEDGAVSRTEKEMVCWLQFSSWRHETEDDWARNDARPMKYDECEPYYPGEEQPDENLAENLETDFIGFGVLQRHKERRATRDRKRCRKAA